MPRKSSIKTLPKTVLDEVNSKLAADELTLDELVAFLDTKGHPRSRSALGRHKKKLDKVAKDLRRSREMADALVKEIGPSASEGKTGRLLIEILQKLVFDHLLYQVDGDGGSGGDDAMGSMDFMLLAKTMKELASAGKIDTDRELKIRAETAKDAAKAVEAVAKSHGLTKKTIADFRGAILGVQEAAPDAAAG